MRACGNARTTSLSLAVFEQYRYAEASSPHDSDPPIVKARREIEQDSQSMRTASRAASARTKNSEASKANTRPKRATTQFKVGPVTRSRKVHQNVRFAGTFDGVYLSPPKSGRSKQQPGHKRSDHDHGKADVSASFGEADSGDGSSNRAAGSSMCLSGVMESPADDRNDADDWEPHPMGVENADDSLEITEEGLADEEAEMQSHRHNEPGHFETEEMRLLRLILQPDEGARASLGSKPSRKGKERAES
ncbi:hypothetical protein BDV93DRAFT_562794 [Ceratobasidium sp. AG-I]|nr:hypothetical protein BDV93DRAFT_562794 [Ceratobasidium sp. AG-I]